MRLLPRHLLASVLITLAACDQQPVGLSVVSDDLPWRTLASFPLLVESGPVWGSAASDIYLGYRPTSDPDAALLHFDGAAWQPVPLNAPVAGIWGSGPADVYVAAYSGPLQHFDGGGWAEVAGIQADWVTGSAPNDVYAGDAGNVFHFDGNTWEQVLDTPYLRAFWAGPGNTALAAVYSGGADSLRWWDGNAWSSTASPGGVNALWGPDGNHIVAVGVDSLYNGAAWTWNGASWSADVVPPDLPPLLSIHGTGASDALAAGRHGTLLRYDGTQWQPIPVPTAHDLRHVWAAGPARGIVTGNGGTVLASDGGDWEPVFDYPVHGRGPMWAEDRETIVLASGSRNGIHVFENGSWHEEPIEDFNELLAIDGRSRADLYAGLWYYGVYHYDGAAWTAVLDSLRYVTDIYVLPTGHVCVTDERDGLFTFGGGVWKHIPYPTSWYFSAEQVWASAIDDVWMAGAGYLARCDGTTIRRVDLEGYTYSVWGSAAEDVYVVGSRGIHHYNGSTLHRVGPAGGYSSVTGSAGRVLATGLGQAYLDGGYWHYLPAPSHVVDYLITARDGTIMSVATQDGITVEIRELPAGEW